MDRLQNYRRFFVLQKLVEALNDVHSILLLRKYPKSAFFLYSIMFRLNIPCAHAELPPHILVLSYYSLFSFNSITVHSW